MSQALIPEVIRTELSKETNSKEQTLNINLNNTVDKRVNNYNQTYNNTTNNTYNQRGGFFRFLFNVLILPFTIIKFIWV